MSLGPFGLAFDLIASGDPELMQIIGLSLRVTLTAVAIGCALGLPLGAALALARFPGRSVVVVVFNALMGLPPVVAGLAIYLLLSRSGPLGPLGLLFTPTAMVLAQTILILPIVISLTRSVIEVLWDEYQEQFRSLGSGRIRAVPTLLWDGRFSLLGYDAPQSVLPGDLMTVTFYWMAREPDGRGYTVFVHLLDEAGQLVAQSEYSVVTTFAPVSG